MFYRQRKPYILSDSAVQLLLSLAATPGYGRYIHFYVLLRDAPCKILIISVGQPGSCDGRMGPYYD
jgi:hypothetical protein